MKIWQHAYYVEITREEDNSICQGHEGITKLDAAISRPPYSSKILNRADYSEAIDNVFPS